MKDIRYRTIKPLLLQGQIGSFADIFKYIPESVVALDLGLDSSRFARLMADVGMFRVSELLKIAELCELESVEIFRLVEKHYNNNALPKAGH